MALSAFDDNARKPTRRTLETTLGRTGAHWNDLAAVKMAN